MIVLAALLALQADATPDLEGHVTKAFSDGARTLLTLTTGSLVAFGDRNERTVFLGPGTKLAYEGIPRGERKPGAGLFVRLWLAGGPDAPALRAVFSKPEDPPAVKLPAAGENAVVIEAEDLELRAVEALPLEGASGGRAILFRDPRGRASADIPLRRGVYEVSVVMTGRHTYHDAVYLSIEHQRRRWFQERWGSLDDGETRDGRPVYVDIPSDGNHPVVLSFAEKDVWVDRIVLRPVALPDENDRPARPDAKGHLRDWLVLAPFPAIPGLPVEKQVDGFHLDDDGRLRPREGVGVDRNRQLYIWTAVRTPGPTLDLDGLIGGRAARAQGEIAYAVCSAWSPGKREGLRLHVASDGPAKAYVNGRRVLRVAAPRDFDKDESRADGITLEAGENLVVLKLVGQGDGWRARVRFTAAGGAPVADLRVAAPTPAP